LAGETYRLGPRLLSLAAAAARDLPLRDLAHPHLVTLARETGESAQLYVRDGDRRICVDAVESSSELRTIVGIGAALPLDQGSAGKVFLAWDAANHPSGPGTDPAELDRIRRRGWAKTVGERESGVASVSAPVLGADGVCLAVVSVSGPAARFGSRGTAARYAGAVVAAAEQIALAAS
jgi:DNA-binding IclR family transcriptional regulator